MQLKELMVSLVDAPKQEVAKAIYLVDCPEKVGDDFADAIAKAEVAFYDKVDFSNVGVFIGSTEYLRASIEHLSVTDLDQSWPRVCDMMGW